jgi:two-component system OmpR family sensor kinase
MNELEKRSFYSFLGLYILSSFLFLIVIGYWYYAAQKRALENETYYRLQHSADVIAGEIIMAHMQHRPLKEPAVPKGINVSLVDAEGRVVKGSMVVPSEGLKPGYGTRNGIQTFVSDAPKEHLGIAYVITQSRNLETALEKLRQRIILVMSLVALLIVLVAWVLSRIFMRPVRERVAQVERFINDITHELNTPISSLSMATDQALKKGECSEKTLKNIAISTRQLYDIYRSLTHLNFRKVKEDEVTPVDIAALIEKSVAYYRPLAEVKRIGFSLSVSACRYPIPEAQAILLFGNLIGNAIKYSSPHTTITIDLQQCILSIRDQGIGIADEKQQEIFERFRRGTEYSGGFGVGLSIVKQLCEEYGIRIVLDSVPQVGTEFRLYFDVS